MTEKPTVRCIDCWHWRGRHGWCEVARRTAGSARGARHCAVFEQVLNPVSTAYARLLAAALAAWAADRERHRAEVAKLRAEVAGLRGSAGDGLWRRLFRDRQFENEDLRRERAALSFNNAALQDEVAALRDEAAHLRADIETLRVRIEWLNRKSKRAPGNGKPTRH